MKIKVLLALYQFYSFQLILSFWIDFSTKLVQIMTQEFAKTPILRQPGKILPPVISPEKTKKSLYSSSFLYYHHF